MDKTIWRVASSLLQRLYREDYHKHKDKIHTTYDTPDIKQVKMNQNHLSDVRSHNLCHKCSCLCACGRMAFKSVVCSLHIPAVVQREVQQQQRSADLDADHTWADALLQRQSDLQRGTVKRDARLLRSSRKPALNCVFVLLAEIQRGSDLAERPRVLPVQHARDGPRSQHHQIQGTC